MEKIIHRSARRMRFLRRLVFGRRSELLQDGISFPDAPELISERMIKKIREGRYEFHELKIGRALINSGDTVLEVGAGLGFLSACLRRDSRARRIVCYEANADLVSYIANLHKVNGITGVEVRHAAVVGGHELDSIPLQIRYDLWESSTLRGGEAISHTVAVPAVRLAAVLSEVQPSVVLMDVEGLELELLTGCDLGSTLRVAFEAHPHVYGMAGIARIYYALDRQGFIEKPSGNGKVFCFERSNVSID